MDFGTLLQEAQRNDKSGKNGSNYYKTKFDPPKKESKSRTLSANIQKFLAKKEEEERTKVEEAKRKREELIALRDEKTKNKIRKTLKTIKSANKSVLFDAVDNNNTAVTLAGPDQPDEDDCGYVSQEASALYSKMMEKYKSIPDEEKFASAKKHINHDLLGTKDRVRAAILRHQEEEMMPHKRKRRSQAVGSPADNDYEEEDSYVEEKKEEKPKIRKAAPPPLDFNELLKLAEKKQFEPVVIETKKTAPTEESERLMTKKQKREYEQYKAYKEAKSRRDQEREANDTKDSKKPRPEVSSRPEQPRPSNPLSIRIPKLGEKNSVEKKTPLPSNTNGDKDRNQLQKRTHSEIDIKQKKDDYRPKPSSTEERKSAQLSSNKERMVKQGERNFKIPSNKLSSNMKKDTSDVRKESSKIPQNSDSVSKYPDSKPSGMGMKATTSDDRNRKVLNHSSSNQKIIERSKESQKQAPRPSQSDHFKQSNSISSTQPSSSNAKPAPNVDTKRKYLPQDIRYQKDESDSRNPKQQLSSNKNTVVQSNSDSKPTKITSANNLKQPYSDPKKPQVLDKNKTPSSLMANKNVKPPEKGSRNVSSNSQNNSRPTSSINGQRGGPSNVNPRPFPPSDVKGARQFPPADVKGARQFPPSDVKGARQFPPADVKGARQFPPADVRGSRQFPPPDVRGPRKFPPKDAMSRGGKRPVKRRIDDDDSEYDSELDDFIDDGPEDGNDYSSYIKEIFGYDKSRYRDEDDDVDNMESNFSQVMKEEFISKKIGLMEDLEDMRLEALEKKKKSQKKRRRISDD